MPPSSNSTPRAARRPYWKDRMVLDSMRTYRWVGGCIVIQLDSQREILEEGNQSLGQSI